MKRDMDLCRLILLKIEESTSFAPNLKIEGYDDDTIAYHCKMMYDYGLIRNYHSVTTTDGILFSVGGLTWEGHDFLDKVRDNSRWRKVKDIIAEKGLPMILDTIKPIADALITAAVDSVIQRIKNGGI